MYFPPLSKFRENFGEPEARGQRIQSTAWPMHCLGTKDRLLILNKPTSWLLPDWNTAKLFTFFSCVFYSLLPICISTCMLSCTPLGFIHWIPVPTTYAELILHQQLTCSFFVCTVTVKFKFTFYISHNQEWFVDRTHEISTQKSLILKPWSN